MGKQSRKKPKTLSGIETKLLLPATARSISTSRKKPKTLSGIETLAILLMAWENQDSRKKPKTLSGIETGNIGAIKTPFTPEKT